MQSVLHSVSQCVSESENQLFRLSVSMSFTLSVCMPSCPLAFYSISSSISSINSVKKVNRLQIVKVVISPSGNPV